MAGGMVIQGDTKDYGGKITMFVLMTCLVAATGGLIFGYDLGISGGVTSMDVFLEKFFPSVYRKMQDDTGKTNQYCKFDSQVLTSFTSSLYIAALVASFAASVTTRIFGRKVSMLVGGIIFLIGSALNGAATNVTMLILGRILLGIGVGYANQSVPVYLSEMAPAKLRGALNMGFQLAITIGLLVANLVNYGTAKIKGGYGWRVSLALAAKIRGNQEVEEEFQDLIEASEAAKKIEHPWRNILQPRYRPQLIMSIMIPFFQQFTGINVIMFYAPVLFKTIGFGDDAALMSAVITGLVNMFATFVSIGTVDRVGRRMLFLEGGIQMLICQILVGVILGMKFGVEGVGSMSKLSSYLVLILICAYVAAFAWSWGPLGWLVPSEIFPLEIRSAGQAINVSVNMFFTFIIAQAFLTMLCHMKFGLFFFFAAFVLIMTLFIFFFLPETKNVPIEEMNNIWKKHWFWGKYIPDDAVVGVHHTSTKVSTY
ncbi:hypothetical protein C5167_025113 [Papaver somniferum]|uniref:Major facilitator superfamily (MFS) profile domain-containing protein n=1 Tax=Papaver somniferum TaxID=3469 RepID=A0A4Y7JUG0_PAPSO|nr:hypothetical protein C5167_025113 [Papaver somniferum]